MADSWGGAWGNPSAWGFSWGSSPATIGSGKGRGKGNGHKDEPALIAPFIKWTFKKKKEAEQQAEVIETEAPVEAPLVPKEGPALVAPDDYSLFLKAYLDNQAEIDRLSSTADQMHRIIEIIEDEMAALDDEDVLALLLH